MRDQRGDSGFAENFREITVDELREFLEADLSGATADPKFKVELRQRLWNFLENSRDRVDTGGDGD
jgi:hypothetical protein